MVLLIYYINNYIIIIFIITNIINYHNFPNSPDLPLVTGGIIILVHVVCKTEPPGGYIIYTVSLNFLSEEEPNIIILKSCCPCIYNNKASENNTYN